MSRGQVAARLVLARHAGQLPGDRYTAAMTTWTSNAKRYNARVQPSLADLTVPPPPPGPADWNAAGVVALPRFMPDALIDAYCDRWRADNVIDRWRPTGWPYETPYMNVGECADLFTFGPLVAVLEALIGEPAGLHLCLTGWVTTQRDWHQDTYLNPAHVGDAYAAVWVALDDVDPDSGPFQYVPGSHRWPTLQRDRFSPWLDLADPSWPTHSERLLRPLYDAEIVRRGAEVVTWLPVRGDVLIWHGRLLHRGSVANVPGLERRAAIAHYSGIDHRPDMPVPYRRNAGWVFPIVTHPRPSFPR